MESDSLYGDSGRSHDFLPVPGVGHLNHVTSAPVLGTQNRIWLQTSSCMGIFRDRNLPIID